MRGVAPIRLADYLPWCEEQGVGVDPGSSESRADYAAELTLAHGGFESSPADRRVRAPTETG